MASLQFTASPGLDLHKVSRTYDTATRPQDDDNLFAEAVVAEGGVRVDAGEVTVSGRKVTRPRFERDTISWSEAGPGGYFAGVLHFLPDGLAFTGRTYAGATADQAKAETLAGVTPPTVFTTQVATAGAASDPPTPNDASGWEPGVELTLGYQLPTGSAFPEPVIKLAGNDATQYVALSVDDTTEQLVVTVLFDQTMAEGGSTISPVWPASAQVELSWDGASFKGFLCPYDSTTGEPSTLEHVWEGTSPALASAAHAQQDGDAAPAAGQVEAYAAVSLSIPDLLTQSPVGADQIANNLLVQNLQWAIPDEWRTDFFGVTKPDLSGQPARVNLINESLDFYQKEFGPAYIGWAVNNVAGPGAPTHPLSSDEKRTLQYYLQNGLGQSKGYNVQSQGIALTAFIDACPRLSDYIADTSSNWAQQAYDELTTPAFLNLIMNMIIAKAEMTVPNRYTSILNALQPSGDLSTKYYKTILIRTLTHISEQVDLTSADAVGDWLPDVIQAFITKFITAPANPTQAQLELQKQAEALQQAVAILGSVELVGQAMTDILLASTGGSLTASARAAADEFARRFPKLALAGNSMLLMFWAGGVYASITSACNWSKLTTQEKISLVTGIVEQFGKMVEAVPDLLDVGAWVGQKGMTLVENIREWWSTPQSVAELDALCDSVEGSWPMRICNNIKSMFNAAKGAIETDGTLLARFFKLVPTMMKWLGAAVAAVFAALAIWQFVDDLMNGAPTLNTAFDEVIAATALIVLVCAIAEIFVDLVFVPVLGAIAAVIGLIFAIVEMFLPKPKQKTPVDTFMDKTLRPFVDGLPDAPPDWAPPGAPVKPAVVTA